MRRRFRQDALLALVHRVVRMPTANRMGARAGCTHRQRTAHTHTRTHTPARVRAHMHVPLLFKERGHEWLQLLCIARGDGWVAARVKVGPEHRPHLLQGPHKSNREKRGYTYCVHVYMCVRICGGVEWRWRMHAHAAALRDWSHTLLPCSVRKSASTSEKLLIDTPFTRYPKLRLHHIYMQPQLQARVGDRRRQRRSTRVCSHAAAVCTYHTPEQVWHTNTPKSMTT